MPLFAGKVDAKMPLFTGKVDAKMPLFAGKQKNWHLILEKFYL